MHHNMQLSRLIRDTNLVCPVFVPRDRTDEQLLPVWLYLERRFIFIVSGREEQKEDEVRPPHNRTTEILERFLVHRCTSQFVCYHVLIDIDEKGGQA